MTDRESPIAMIAMALRAPGSETPEEFWANILGGRDTLTRATETQLRRVGVPERLIKNPMYVRSRLVLRAPGGFDAAFFDMSGHTAKTTDPRAIACSSRARTKRWSGLASSPVARRAPWGVFGGGGGGQDGYVIRNFGGGAVDLDDPAVWWPRLPERHGPHPRRGTVASASAPSTGLSNRSSAVRSKSSEYGHPIAHPVRTRVGHCRA